MDPDCVVFFVLLLKMLLARSFLTVVVQFTIKKIHDLVIGLFELVSSGQRRDNCIARSELFFGGVPELSKVVFGQHIC